MKEEVKCYVKNCPFRKTEKEEECIELEGQQSLFEECELEDKEEKDVEVHSSRLH